MPIAAASLRDVLEQIQRKRLGRRGAQRSQGGVSAAGESEEAGALWLSCTHEYPYLSKLYPKRRRRCALPAHSIARLRHRVEAVETAPAGPRRSFPPASRGVNGRAESACFDSKFSRPFGT